MTRVRGMAENGGVVAPALVSLAGFLPWIVYWILVGNVSFETSVLVALAVSVAVNAATFVRRRSLNLFEAGATAIFAALLVVVLAGEESFLERWVQPLSNLGILVVALATVVAGRPFTLEYAKESISAEVQATAGFAYVNRILTWVWIAAFAVMTVASFIPPIVQGEATIRDGASALSIACYWVIPYTALALAGIVTAKFPDWFVAGIDRQLAPAGRAPVAPAAPVAPLGAAADGALRLIASPASAPLDGPLDVSVEGAAPGAEVAFDAVLADAFGTPWRSRATATADAAGRAAADGPGLVWSMEPAADGPVGVFAPASEPAALTIRAEAGGASLECSAVRGAATGVRIVPVRDGDVVGRLHLPAGPEPHAGVLVLPGSEGGLDSQSSLATLLATRGYAAMVQAYFGAEGLGDHIEALPLERVAAGLAALGGRPEVDGDRMAAMSISKGSEALLAMAAAIPGLPLRALVLLSPSSVAWQAVGGDGAVPGASSWTVGGEPVPFLPIHEEALMSQLLRNELLARSHRRHHQPALVHLAATYAPALDDGAARDRAALAADRVPVPLLLAAGEDDQLWPSARMAAEIAERRRGMDPPQPDELIVLPGAGHLLRPPLLPTAEAWLDGIAFGGNPAGMAAGHERLWAATLAFLDGHLRAR